MERKLLYYPAFGSGSFKDAFKKDLVVREYIDKTTGEKKQLSFRFYNEEYKNVPEFASFYHPYLLISAGHSYKYPDYRKYLKIDSKCHVIGDSGGYQFCRGVLNWEPKYRKIFFEWLENNSDIAINLDLPPRYIYAGKFDYCLSESLKNFEYFDKHQTGKTKFLNVIQGNNQKEYEIWYENVKDFNFHGWAIGGANNINKILYLFCFLKDKGELEKAKNRNDITYIHFLGKSKVVDFFILAILQQIVNKKYDNKIQLTLDSASPERSVVYGVYYINADYKNLIFQVIKYKKDFNKNFGENETPCFINCPVCSDNNFLNTDIQRTTDEITSAKMKLHNFFIFKKVIEDIYKLLNLSDEVLSTYFYSEIVTARKLIRQIIDSENSLNEYLKNQLFFNEFFGRFDPEGVETFEETQNIFF